MREKKLVFNMIKRKPGHFKKKQKHGQTLISRGLIHLPEEKQGLITKKKVL